MTAAEQTYQHNHGTILGTALSGVVSSPLRRSFP